MSTHLLKVLHLLYTNQTIWLKNGLQFPNWGTLSIFSFFIHHFYFFFWEMPIHNPTPLFLMGTFFLWVCRPSLDYADYKVKGPLSNVICNSWLFLLKGQFGWKISFKMLWQTFNFIFILSVVKVHSFTKHLI
jgi:hypothetical protein